MSSRSSLQVQLADQDPKQVVEVSGGGESDFM